MSFFSRQSMRRGLTVLRVLAFLLFSAFITSVFSLPSFCLGSEAAEGVPPLSENALFTYGVKISLALLLLWGGAWAFVRWSPPRWRGRKKPGGKKLQVLETLAVGRGQLYALACGPQVVVVFVRSRETLLLGRWPREVWYGTCLEKIVVEDMESSSS